MKELKVGQDVFKKDSAGVVQMRGERGSVRPPERTKGRQEEVIAEGK